MSRAIQTRRPAYTLMEIVLVMALVVMLAAISVPVIQTMLDDARAIAAGDMIRGRVADARARALESGRPWRLAFIPNTDVFQLAPEDSSEWSNMPQDATETQDLIRDKLPKDIVFAINAGDIAGSKEPQPPGDSWQTIGIYSFDGAARDDSTTYFGKRGLMPMRVRLRGLTGTITVDSAIEVKADQP